MKDFREQNYYELLDLAPHASIQELEAAYQRARRIFSPDSVVTYALFQPEELALLRRRIEEAYRTLSNPERRKRYDEAMDRLDGGAAAEVAEEPAGEAPTPDGQAAPAPPATPDGAAAAAPQAPAAAVADLPLFQRPPSQPPPAAPEEGGAMPPLFVEVSASPAAAPPEPPVAASPAPAPAAPTLIVAPASTPPAAPAPSAPPASSAPPPAEVAAPATSPPTPAAGPAVQPPPAGQVPPPMPTLDETTVYDGHLLRQVREARGMDLERLAQATKINIFYLRRLEENDFSDLPAPVYVRGYLRQLARLLKLDAERLLAGFDALRAGKA